jgi:hypothetical protein
VCFPFFVVRFCLARSVLAAAGVAISACAKSDGQSSVLQPFDLASTGDPFDRNEIVDSASMQDEEALTEADIAAFLARTPYGAPSFLSGYVSNGLGAAAAIARAAQRYALSPMVFLVRAQMDQGLVGDPAYPQPASRVEYAFGCGCAAPGECDPAYAGFDVQVDCLGAALRDSLDQIAATGATAGGWGPGLTAATRDSVPVTPRDDSTAALYQYTPVIAVGQAGGNWLFWNLWQKYAAAIGYGGPPAGPPGRAAWIGASCAGSAVCNYDGVMGTCAMQFPSGLCTLSCTQSCPSSPSEVPTFCADLGSQGGLCLAVCNPVVPQCRPGYSCKSTARFGDAKTTGFVCAP